MNEKEYIARGSMCAACINRDRSCKHLEFAKMPVIQQHDIYNVVLCKEFRKVDK